MPNTKSATQLELESFDLLKLEVPSIEGQERYDVCVERRTILAQWLKDAEAVFKDIKDPVWQEHKRIIAQEHAVCDPVSDLMRKMNAELLRFDREQEAKRREQQWLIDEARRKLEEQERIDRAAAAEAQGMDAKTVEAVLDTPVALPVVVAQKGYEASRAVGYRDNYSAEITDLFALVKFVAKNKQYLNLLAVDQPNINKLAKALREQLNIPGVKVVNNRIAVSGRG